MSQPPVRQTVPSWPIVLSILAALLTLGLKFFAYLVSGSIGLLSDALESVINLVAAILAFVALWYAAQPPDSEHTYGHEKISYFSSGIEGMLILVAAASIAWQAVERLVFPQPLARLDLGLLSSALASFINWAVAVLLIREGKKHRSIILEADGYHLMTDVWTSGAILVALGVVWFAGWAWGANWVWLDPTTAILVSLNILWTGLKLMRRSFDGLMDHAWPQQELESLRLQISDYLQTGMAFHALRTRTSGTRRLVEFHLLVPGTMSVRDAHAFAEDLESKLIADEPKLDITIHLEPIEEASSWGDHELVGFEKG
jgi:cation diffusion facilitator family transporter